MTRNTRITVANPELVNARKSPLLSALFLMSLSSFAPLNNPACFTGTNLEVCNGSASSINSQVGWYLFNTESQKNARKAKKNVALAKAKGVALPRSIATLPDDTLECLKEQGIVPDFVNKSQEDSLIIEFTFDNTYHMAEFCPDGEIVLLRRNSGGIDAWDLNADTYFDKLEEFLSVEQEATLTE